MNHGAIVVSLTLDIRLVGAAEPPENRLAKSGEVVRIVIRMSHDAFFPDHAGAVGRLNNAQ